MEVILPIVVIACIVMFWINTWFKGQTLRYPRKYPWEGLRFEGLGSPEGSEGIEDSHSNPYINNKPLQPISLYIETLSSGFGQFSTGFDKFSTGLSTGLEGQDMKVWRFDMGFGRFGQGGLEVWHYGAPKNSRSINHLTNHPPPKPSLPI